MVKVLVIDDDLHYLRLVKHLLADQPYNVLLAASAVQGIRLMRKERPRLVLSDLKLPGADGFDLLLRLRRIDQKAGFIVITGYASGENLERAFHIGVNRFLEKPLSLDRLLETIRDVSYESRLSEARSRLRMCHDGSCPFGSCLLKGENPCPDPACPHEE